MAEIQSHAPYIMPELVENPFPKQPEEMSADEVWVATQKIQTSLSAQYSLIDTGFDDQETILQDNQTEITRQFEQQNLLLERQQMIQVVDVGLLFLALVFAIVSLISICKQKKKLRAMQEKVDQLEDLNRRLVECHNRQNSNIEAIWNKVFAVNETTLEIADRIRRGIVTPPTPPSPPTPPPKPPEPKKPPLQDMLPQTLIQVAMENHERWGEQVKQALTPDYHFDISYYCRPDPTGNLYQGIVKKVADDNAPFFGVILDGCLQLFPNKAALNNLTTCAEEFFVGYDTVRDGVQTVRCALLNQDGDLWRLVQLGSINQ